MTDGKIIEMVQPGPIGDGISISPDKILEAATGQLSDVVLIGTAADGSLYVAGSGSASESYALVGLAGRYLLNESAIARGWD